MRFQYLIIHVPGKTPYMADTLSRPPVNTVTHESSSDVERYIQSVISALPATEDYLEAYCRAQRQGPHLHPTYTAVQF